MAKTFYISKAIMSMVDNNKVDSYSDMFHVSIETSEKTLMVHITGQLYS